MTAARTPACAHITPEPLPFQRTQGSPRIIAAMGLAAGLLAGCYVVPVNPDGSIATVPVAGAIVTLPPHPAPGETAATRPAFPATLPVRLYPANDLANQTGVLTGSVTNYMNGKGRFSFIYQGETLVGEATRVANDERRGLASAHGPRGTFARCEYQMNAPNMGAGTCAFSNGAQYQVHIGS